MRDDADDATVARHLEAYILWLLGARVTLGAAEHDLAEQLQYVGLQVPGDSSVVSGFPHVVHLQNGSSRSMQVCTNISTK